MEKRREMFLKAFLDECPAEKKEDLLRYLPEKEKHFLDSLPSSPLPTVAPTMHPLDLIHWSWLSSIFRNYTTEDQEWLLLALREETQKSLAKELGLSILKENLSRTGIDFLRKTLFLALRKEELLPIEYLPPSPFNLLLSIDKKQLIQWIDLLSLYDLSMELRQIVDTKMLQKIHSFLSDAEKTFLQAISGHKEPYPPARISLEEWDGSNKSFRTALHRIGLSRLGSALSGQNEDLIWYLCHKLDQGRGKALEKLSIQNPIPEVAEWLIAKMTEFL